MCRIGFARCGLALVASCLMALALTAQTAAGVWKGDATGNGIFFSSEPVHISLLLEQSEGGKVSGRFYLQGFRETSVEGRFDDATGTLEFEADLERFTCNAKVQIEGDSLIGSFAALGKVRLEAQRIGDRVLQAPQAPSSPVDVQKISAEDWGRELRVLRDYLPQVHVRAHHTISREAWRSSLTRLESRVSELDGLAVVVEMAKVVASVGDAHTGLGWREIPGFETHPVILRRFPDGIFVTAVDENWSEALGARLVRIGDTPAEEVYEAVSKLFAAENEAWRSVQAPGLMTIPKLLAILGIVESPDSLPLVLEIEPGTESEVSLAARGAGKWSTAPDPNYDPVPLWQRRTSENYWYTVLPDQGAVYLAYNTCAENPSRPMGAFVDAVLGAIDTSGATRLLIDLRNNSGGNSLVLSQHLERIGKHDRIRAPGSIVGLIGPATYSSGMMNAQQLRDRVGATLVGEATGGKPNCYGEMRSFRLPHSGLRVYYSIKYFRMLDTDPPSVEPDVKIELTAADYFAGHDPVLAELGH